MQGKDDEFKFAYLDKTSGLLLQRIKKETFRSIGYDFYTTEMNEYKNKWEKIR